LGARRYNGPVKAVRFLVLLIYVGYLVQVGLLLLLLPWSQGWGQLLAWIPVSVAGTLDLPIVRGLISGFGALHLLLLAAELQTHHGAERGRS